jgi:hypothetical protein
MSTYKNLNINEYSKCVQNDINYITVNGFSHSLNKVININFCSNSGHIGCDCAIGNSYSKRESLTKHQINELNAIVEVLSKIAFSIEYNIRRANAILTTYSITNINPHINTGIDDIRTEEEKELEVKLIEPEFQNGLGILSSTDNNNNKIKTHIKKNMSFPVFDNNGFPKCSQMSTFYNINNHYFGNSDDTLLKLGGVNLNNTNIPNINNLDNKINYNNPKLESTSFQNLNNNLSLLPNINSIFNVPFPQWWKSSNITRIDTNLNQNINQLDLGQNIPNLNMPNLNIPNLNIPNLNMPNLNIPNLNMPNLNIPNLNLNLNQNQPNLNNNQPNLNLNQNQPNLNNNQPNLNLNQSNLNNNQPNLNQNQSNLNLNQSNLNNNQKVNKNLNNNQKVNKNLNKPRRGPLPNNKFLKISNDALSFANIAKQNN